MADLFKTLSSGLSRFVLSWLLPSVLTVGFFVWLVLPSLHVRESPHGRAATSGLITASAVFVLASVTLAVLFAYCSQPIYRLLEGYTMPATLARRLRRRQLREWHRLDALSALGFRDEAVAGLHIERRSLYPEERDDVQATRLGNALRAMEGYGASRFGLDQQSLWYELMTVAPTPLRSDLEDTRSAVDFFVSLLSHCALLAAVSAPIGAATGDPVPMAVAAVAIAVAWASYRGAVQSVLEWRYALQALVNTGRPQLATSLGFALPDDFATERQLWESFAGHTIDPQPSYLEWLDQHRLSYTPGGRGASSSSSS
jgi:hypothetical protein